MSAKDASAAGSSGGERVLSGPQRTLTFILPALVVGALILLLIQVQARAEAAAADLASLLPFGFAFAAGIVASVNPCGFLLLPTYISFQLGGPGGEIADQPLARRLVKAVGLGLLATLGFMAVSAMVGVLVSAGGQLLIELFPYTGLLIGAAMVGLGIWLLVTHANLGIMAASRLTIDPQRNPLNVFWFGVVYAAGSLSCTLPIFLVVVGSALATQGLLASFGQFVSYALGMGLVLILATVGTALFRDAVLQALKRAIPYVHRASALFLIGAGAYLLYYWIFFADAFA